MALDQTENKNLYKAHYVCFCLSILPLQPTTLFFLLHTIIRYSGYLMLIDRRFSTVADVARKVMGDAPVAYIEGTGGVRVSEDSIVEVGKNDVSTFNFYHLWFFTSA